MSNDHVGRKRKGEALHAPTGSRKKPKVAGSVADDRKSSGADKRVRGGRERPPNHHDRGAGTKSRPNRQQNRRDAYKLAAQTTSKAFSNGALDVDKFVRAREFEIQALREGMQRSKKVRSERAFQSVPRDMRRRAGAWDAKRVPKRKREKAAREQRDDKTPGVKDREKARRGRRGAKEWLRMQHRHKGRTRADTVASLNRLASARTKQEKDQVKGDALGSKTRDAKTKRNTLRDPPVPKARFRKRQMNKTWLPTHLWHAKRAHMSPPLEPVWRFALPLTPTQKSYRPTHRAATERGAIAWDVSYISTTALIGTEKSLLNLMRGLGVDDAYLHGHRGILWRQGRRSWQGWAFRRDTGRKTAIAPITVIWQAEDDRKPVQTKVPAADDFKAYKRKLLMRVHPSAFHQFWEELVRLCAVQKPEVKAEDLRYDLGSIEVRGPGATEALHGVLQPSQSSGDDLTSTSELWQSLVGLDNPASLPVGAMFHFKITDPRLRHPPRPVKVETDTRALLSAVSAFDEMIPASPQAIFDSRSRRASVAAMQSQKALDRRKAAAAPGKYPESVPGDPAIPVLMYTTDLPAADGAPSHSRSASWTVLLPWRATTAVWQSLMYYPLSGRGQVRFGGLREQRQLAFERGMAWFPGDFPGTEAGDKWTEREGEERKKAWDRKPRSRRPNLDALDLGNGEKGEIDPGWSLPWDRVFEGSSRENDNNALDDGEKPSGDTSHLQTANGADQSVQNPSQDHCHGRTHAASKPWHCQASLARIVLARSTATEKRGVSSSSPKVTSSTMRPVADEIDVKNALIGVRLMFLGRGVPTTAARVYRVPKNDADLRQKWADAVVVALTGPKTTNNNKPFKRPPDRPLPLPSDDAALRRLAKELLLPRRTAAGADHAGGDQHPPCPRKEDLVGFVTRGEFNLSQGKGTAMASLSLRAVLEDETAAGERGRICIVRNAGEVVGRLATWELA